MKSQPMLQVDDVEASSRWYQAVLGMISGHGGTEYEMLFAGTPHETPMILQLHRWAAHEHGHLGDPELPRGNGCSLWFEVADKTALDTIWGRVEEKSVHVLEAPHWNELAHHHEFAIRDPDGYVVVIATPFSSTPG